MKVYCTLPFTRMKINSDGEYHSCCHQNIHYGNIITEDITIKEAFDKDIIKDIQNSILGNNLHDACNTPRCPFYSKRNELDTLFMNDVEYTDQPIDFELSLPSSHCNIGGTDPTPDTACPMCPRASVSFIEHEPSIDLIEIVLDKLKPIMNKVKILNIQGIAEPFWKGKVFEILNKLDFKKYRNVIHFWSFTNGTVFGDKIQDKFIEMVGFASLGFSIDAATPETYIKVRKLNYFKTIERNLKKYFEKTKNLKNENGWLHSFTTYNINMINVHEMEQMVRWSHGIGADRTEFTLTFISAPEIPIGTENICNKDNWHIFWEGQQRAMHVAKELNYSVTFYVPFHGGFLNN